jgi:endonuclease-3
LEQSIRRGGLAPTKAPRIQAVLRELGNPIDLDWLENAPRDEAIPYLTALPGVGRKTAACVMIFSFDRPEIPVDTHVHRVGGRLGLFRSNASWDEAHDEMLRVTPPEDAYELHVNLIRHGRTLCRPARPKCSECALRRMCPHARSNRNST